MAGTKNIEQPPLFGWNIPQGGFEVLQEPETPPMFGQVAPQVAPLTAENPPLGFFEQESAEVTTPMPTPTPTPSPIPTPDDGSSPLAGQNTQPGGGILQEPEDDETEDEPEDDGQEDSPEGTETSVPLT